MRSLIILREVQARDAQKALDQVARFPQVAAKYILLDSPSESMPAPTLWDKYPTLGSYVERMR